MGKRSSGRGPYIATWTGSGPFFFTSIVVVAQLAFTYLPVMNLIFGSVPLSFTDGLGIIAIGALSLGLLEVEKHLLRDRFAA